MSAEPFQVVRVAKVDSRLGIVFGYGIECLQDGKKIFDTQKSYISEEEMLKSASEFAAGSRLGNDDHDYDDDDNPIPAGEVLFLFPLTTEIAKALDIKTPKTGLLIGYKPPPDILKKYETGEYTGFSIGGTAKRHYLTGAE